MPVTENLEDPAAIISAIQANASTAKEIAVLAQRTVFGVLLNNRDQSKTVLAMAGDPQTEKSLLMLNASIREGRYLQSRHEAIIGAKIAQSLHYSVGDTVKVMTQGSDYALHLKKFAIVGIFESGVVTLDDGVMQVSLDDARDLLSLGQGVQQIVIMLKDYRKSDAIARSLRELLNDKSIAVTPWTRIGDSYRLVSMMSRLYGWLYIIVGLLGAFIISNIMMMVVLERRKEIGILKSMGVTGRQIMALFLSEGMCLGLIGSLVGTAAGTIVIAFFHARGIDLSFALESVNLPLDSIIRPTLSAKSVIAGVCIGTLLAGLMSFLPSRQAAKMNAVDAIKSV